MKKKELNMHYALKYLCFRMRLEGGIWEALEYIKKTPCELF